MDFQIFPLGDQALIVEFGTDIKPEIQQIIQKVSSMLENQPPAWMLEFIPAFTTITFLYKPTIVSYEEAKSQISTMLLSSNLIHSSNQRVINIPVCYGGEFGPDLEIVAKVNSLSVEEVIQIHSAGDYLVYMIGFSPGFPYIGGMSKKISTPRKGTPRLTIPARSVGIAGEQTGIYPIETPGGWQIIGRSPLDLFLPNEDPPSLLRAGDKIKFIPTSIEEYREWEKMKR